MTQYDGSVKILFRFYSNVLEQETVETMWATIVDKNKGLYKLDSIPFYGPQVASDDIIYAEYDKKEQMLTYRKTIEPSGNSIIQVVLMNKAKDINDIRKIFENLGCLSEKANDGYFVLEVLSEKNYNPIKQILAELEEQILAELEEQNIIGYAEPYLSEKHSRH